MRKSTFFGAWLLIGVGIFSGEHLSAQGQNLEIIAPKSASALRSTVLYFGENIRFVADIASEANIPAKELTLSYKFSGDERIEAQYETPFTGERIPGYARKVELEVYKGAANSEKQLLWAHIYEVQQIPPTFTVTNASAEATLSKGKLAKPGECTFSIKGLRVDFAKPVDAEKNRVITALVNDLEVSEPELDTTKTSVQFLSGSKPDDKLNKDRKSVV